MNIKSKTIRDIKIENNVPAATIHKHGTIGDLVSLFATHPECNCVYVVDSDNCILGYIELNELVAELYPYLQQLNNEYFNSFIGRLRNANVTALMRTNNEWAEYSENIDATILKMLLKGRGELPIAHENGKFNGCVKMLHLLELIDAYLKQFDCPAKG